MRGWIVALTILGIAMASTGSLIGEHSYIATASDWSDADFQEREAAGRFLAAVRTTDVALVDNLAADGQVASALADTADKPSSPDDADETQDNRGETTPRGPVRIPSITDSEEPDAADAAPAAAPAPVVTAPRLIEAAPAARSEPVATPRPVEPASSEPLAVVCMAGCGPKKIVYQAVPTPARPERVGGLIHAAVLTNESASPPVIECVAGCYGKTQRAYRAPELPRTRQAAIHGDVAFERPWLRTESESSVRIQRGTRTRRQGN